MNLSEINPSYTTRRLKGQEKKIWQFLIRPYPPSFIRLTSVGGMAACIGFYAAPLWVLWKSRFGDTSVLFTEGVPLSLNFIPLHFLRLSPCWDPFLWRKKPCCMGWQTAFRNTPHGFSQAQIWIQPLSLCFFEESGRLFEEPFSFLKQELRELAFYHSILIAMAGGAGEMVYRYIVKPQLNDFMGAIFKTIYLQYLYLPQVYRKLPSPLRNARRWWEIIWKNGARKKWLK